MRRRWLALWPAVVVLTLAACGPDVAPPPPSSSRPPATSAAPSTVPASPSQVAAPTPAGPGGKIAVARDGNIWVVADGGARQATAIPGAADPSWSPDGKTLAFDTQAKNSADIYVMPYPEGPAKALSTNTNRIVENNLWDMQPSWTADGGSLLFVSDRGRQRTGTLDPAPWRMTAAGAQRTQLANSSAYTGGIDYPRGRPGHPTEMVYTTWGYAPDTLLPYGQLVLMDTQTNKQVPLTAPGTTAFHPDWSADGQTLVYITRAAQQDNVSVMAVPELAQLTGAALPAGRVLLQGRMAHPVFAPDGKGIAYVGLKDGSLDLFVQPLTAELQPSGDGRQLTNGWHIEGASSIDWGP